MGQSDRIDLVRSRFSEAPWLQHLSGRIVTVVGSGGIGSWVTLCLARIGCRVYLYDADKVETHNFGGQMLTVGSESKEKVYEVAELCSAFCGVGTEVIALPEMFDEFSPVSHIMIAAVDNMAARKLIFDKWLDQFKDDESAVLIDGRLLAEDYQVYVVTPQRADKYRATLFSDEEVSRENCSLKATTHCSLGIASDIIGCLTNWVANFTAYKNNEHEVRDVPFSIVKSFPNFLYDLTFSNDTRGKKEERIDNQGVLPVLLGEPLILGEAAN